MSKYPSAMRTNSPKLLWLLVLLLAFCAGLARADTLRLRGTVVDSEGAPVVGASVVFLEDDRVLAGSATDSEGRFQFAITRVDSDSILVRVSAVGFSSETLAVADCLTPISVRMNHSPVNLEGVEVRPGDPEPVTTAIFSDETLERRARQSLVPSNPVGALREIEIARAGTSHSSQLRIHGTNPIYYYNDIAIGTDPHHYGVFSIIPTSAINEVEVDLYGSDASHQLPSVVTLTSYSRFADHRESGLTLSTVEASATHARGTESYFLRGTLRKSVLDKLVDRLDISTDRRTIPPTNFQDVVVSAGWRIAPGVDLLIDQYDARDYLSYLAQSYAGNGLLDSYQHTTDHFWSARLNVAAEDILLSSAISYRRAFDEYRVYPAGTVSEDVFRIDLTERSRHADFSIRGDFFGKQRKLTLGGDIRWTVAQEVDLDHRHWNFLPPMSASNSPYIFQPLLNSEYATFRDDLASVRPSVYLSLNQEIGPLEFTGGLRLDHFGELRSSSELSWRFEAITSMPRDVQVRGFAGTFAESPISHILEPYQVIVRDHIASLEAIRTRLLSLTVERGLLAVTVFDKNINSLPTITPNFSTNSVGGVLGMQSSARANFRGGSIKLGIDNVFLESLNLRASYAYTHAYRFDQEITLPHDLNAPHRFLTHIEYTPHADVTIGAEVSVRSGYPYTPTRAYASPETEIMMTENYYTAALADENSRRFPANATLNLFAEYDFGRGSVYANIANVTNRANPVINTARGYIFDAGVLPTVGVRYEF